MFKKTKKQIQLGIFSSANSLLSGRAENIFQTKDAWHNVFRDQVTLRIDETIFQSLFAEKMGAPNASVRIMISMMILKEANGWSDEQLFEECRFNLLVRSALGLINTDEAIPTESTYYLFRKRVHDYEKLNGENLFEKIFSSITHSQAVDFKVSGKSIRMDSKLIGSNIAWLSRYEIIHETIRLFCRSKKITANHPDLIDFKDELGSVIDEKGSHVVYRITGQEVKVKMQKLGFFTDKLIQLFCNDNSEIFKTLSRVFMEQYTLDDNKIPLLRDKEQITSHTVQSPHDTDSHYRNKNGDEVKGYSINVTESCDKGSLNLIGSVDVRVVSTQDIDFLKPAIDKVQTVFTESIEKVHTDGAYHSPVNQLFCKEKNIDLIVNAIQGMEGRFDLSLNENNKLVVLDRQTGQNMPTRRNKKDSKWAITTGKNKYRYFAEDEIISAQLRKKVSQRPKEERDVRCNVEATIFQLGYHYPNDKSKYRGLIKHTIFAFMRCLWINFRRIKKFLNNLTKNASIYKNYTSISTVNHYITIIQFKFYLLDLW
jgi:hypothetical protein